MTGSAGGDRPLLFVVPTGDVTDMPRLWDGRKVKWSPWEPQGPSSADYHWPREKCTRCGSSDKPLECRGIVQPLSGETVTSYRSKRLASGRTYDKPRQVPAWPVLRLLASRCVRCGLDTVVEWGDEGGHVTWTLGPEDYGAEGSVTP